MNLAPEGHVRLITVVLPLICYPNNYNILKRGLKGSLANSALLNEVVMGQRLDSVTLGLFQPL